MKKIFEQIIFVHSFGHWWRRSYFASQSVPFFVQKHRNKNTPPSPKKKHFTRVGEKIAFARAKPSQNPLLTVRKQS